MNDKQARALCALMGQNPDEAVGEQPRYIAVMAVFDEDGAAEAQKAHDDHWEAKPRTPRPTGKTAKALTAGKEGAK